jgi:small subunit ribosomal protein S1
MAEKEEKAATKAAPKAEIKTATKKPTAKKTTTTKAEPKAKKVAASKKVVAKKVAAPKKVVAKKVAAPKKDEAPKVDATKDAPKTKKVEVKKEEKELKAENKVTSPKKKEGIKPLTDFDWDSLNDGLEGYSIDERTKLEKMYNATLTSIADHTVIDGVVISKSKKEVVVNIGYKSEGVITASEFRYNPELAAGDTVEVYVENTEDQSGQLVLSHSQARVLKAWDRVNDALVTEEIVKGFIKCRTKGGLIVDVFGLEAFLPGSQIDVKPIRDYDVYVNKTMEFKVVKINNEFKNVVVSHKALIEAELEQQKVHIMSKLEKGQVLEGVVKNITSYGVFIDLGGVDGLIHITDLSWGRINHPEELVTLDETINVVILDFDDNKKRIALGLKQLQPHPWEKLDEKTNVGDKVKGKVVVLADYGAFVEIAPGVEGLIHVSEMSWSQHLRTAQDFFSVGDEVEAQIMTMDRDERKMSLSTRQLTQDPWEGIELKFGVETKHSGKVTNLSNFGIFVELDEGIDGLIHISDLSWSKKINHPKEFTKVGEQIDIVVLEIDKENRRLSLGHKQLEENPWEVFQTVFTEGSVHQGTVLQKLEKGFIAGLPYGVEGFCPARHGVKEDGSKLTVEETIDFKVIEFNKESRKIILSHARLHEAEGEGSSKGSDAKKKSTRASSDSKAVKKNNDKQEKSTLGDIDVLSQLKSDMEKGGK